MHIHVCKASPLFHYAVNRLFLEVYSIRPAVRELKMLTRG